MRRDRHHVDGLDKLICPALSLAGKTDKARKHSKRRGGIPTLMSPEQVLERANGAQEPEQPGEGSNVICMPHTPCHLSLQAGLLRLLYRT